MQIRVKNTNKGQRGIYVGGDLVFVDGNATGTFTGATADERDAAATIDGLKVQSRVAHEGEWTDHFKEEMPVERLFFAIATDTDGNNFKPLPDLDGQWIIGYAIAGERPDGAAGYTWMKIGGGVEASETVALVEPEADRFDAAAFVDRNGNTVIADIEAGKATDVDAVRKAENARANPRKGVIAALDAVKA